MNIEILPFSLSNSAIGRPFEDPRNGQAKVMPASKLAAAGLAAPANSAIYAAWTVNRVKDAIIAAAS
jgi:hypothetical protein